LTAFQFDRRSRSEIRAQTLIFLVTRSKESDATKAADMEGVLRESRGSRNPFPSARKKALATIGVPRSTGRPEAQ